MEDGLAACAEDRLHNALVGGTHDVGKDLLIGALVHLDELVPEIVAAIFVVVGLAVVVREILVRSLDLLLANLRRKEVALVEEEDHGGADEPPAVAYLIKEGYCLDHAVNLVILGEHLVVLTQGDNENNGVHPIETVGPLLALHAPAANIWWEAAARVENHTGKPFGMRCTTHPS